MERVYIVKVKSVDTDKTSKQEVLTSPTTNTEQSQVNTIKNPIQRLLDKIEAIFPFEKFAVILCSFYIILLLVPTFNRDISAKSYVTFVIAIFSFLSSFCFSYEVFMKIKQKHSFLIPNFLIRTLRSCEKNKVNTFLFIIAISFFAPLFIDYVPLTIKDFIMNVGVDVLTWLCILYLFVSKMYE